MKTAEFLEHYGVRGMKWGVRRDRKRSETSRTKYQKAPGKLTDAELKRRIQRMEFEKRYNDLNKGDVSAGKAFAHQVLRNTGSAALTTLGTAAAMYVGKMVVGNVFGVQTLQDMFPKKK